MLSVLLSKLCIVTLRKEEKPDEYLEYVERLSRVYIVVNYPLFQIIKYICGTTVFNIYDLR